MNTIFLKILNTSITAGCLAAAVVLLRFALKNAPKWVRCMLWGLVALRLLLPFTIESRLSLLPSAEPIRSETVAAGSAAGTQIAAYDRIVLNSGISVVDDAVNHAATKPEAGAAETKSSAATVLNTAAWVWAIGAAAMLAYAAASFIYMKLKVRVSLRTERNVYVCDAVKSPFILGAFFPKIYLPSNMDERSRAYVLAHERAHIRRLDHIWKPLGFLLLSIHWFNPLLWAAFILLSRDIEFACDEKVISQLDFEGKASYSDTLLAFSRPHRAIAVCPVAFGEVGVKKRIRSVLCYKKSALWAVPIAMVAAAAVGVCFLTSPISAEAAQTLAVAHEETQLESALDDRAEDDVNEGIKPGPEEMETPGYLCALKDVSQHCDTAE